MSETGKQEIRTSSFNKEDEQSEDYEQDDDKYFKSGVLKTVMLSVCFLLLFTAYNSAQNMISTIYSNLGYGDLGNIALFSLYFAFGIASFFGAQLVSFLSPKLVFFISGFLYNGFVGVGFIAVHCPNLKDDPEAHLPTYCEKNVMYSYIIAGSVLCGIAAATIWVSQGGYIELVSSLCPKRSGVFVGIFWALMQCSQIIGNTLSYFLLGLENGTIIYFEVILAIGAVGNVAFLFLPSASPNKTQKKKPTPKIQRMIKLFKTKQIYPLISFMAFTGIQIAFYSGFLHKLVENTLTEEQRNDERVSNQKSAAVFIVLGIFEFISGNVSGYIANKFNIYTLATLGTLMAELALVLSLLGYFLDSYTLCFIIAGIWGFSDCYFNVICQEICQRDYPKYIEIFALFRLVLAVFNSLTQVLVITIKKEWVFILVIIIFQLITNFCTRLLEKPDMSKLYEAEEESLSDEAEYKKIQD